MSDHRFLRLHTLQAGYGDCLVIEYGDHPEEQHLVIIDGGVANETTSTLTTFLNGLPKAHIELLVISHIDDDHIAGAIRLLSKKKLRTRIKDIWFNGSSQQGDRLEKLGFKSGDKLQQMLTNKSLKIPWNSKFGGADVVSDTSTKTTPLTLPLGASVTLLSPTVASLAALREEWAANRITHVSEDTVDTIEPESVAPGDLERMGASEVPAIDVDALLTTTYDEDRSASNGSSIAFLFSFGGASLLLAADAHAKVLLETASLLDGGLPHGIDVLKLPHHGSAANVTTELLKAFPTKTYVVSTNGNKHEHPHDLAIARIVAVAPGSKVLFNYPGAAYQRWHEFSINNSDKLAVDTTRTGRILTIQVAVPDKV